MWFLMPFIHKNAKDDSCKWVHKLRIERTKNPVAFEQLLIKHTSSIY